MEKNNDDVTKRYCLIGYPLEHSFSQKYFTNKFLKEGIERVSYEACPVKTIDEIKAVIENQELHGFNVTIPYKKTIIGMLDSLDSVAQQVQAVNTVKITRDANGKIQRMTGYNTDVYGFEKSIVPLLKPHHTKAIIFGAGGGAQAVSHVLKKLSIKFILVSRSGQKGIITFQQLLSEQIRSHKLLINATPLGMFPTVKGFPEFDYAHLTKEHLLYDLVYNPPETEFLKKGRRYGATIKNGLEMLQLQAEMSWEIWKS